MKNCSILQCIGLFSFIKIRKVSAKYTNVRSHLVIISCEKGKLIQHLLITELQND